MTKRIDCPECDGTGSMTYDRFVTQGPSVPFGYFEDYSERQRRFCDEDASATTIELNPVATGRQPVHAPVARIVQFHSCGFTQDVVRPKNKGSRSRARTGDAKTGTGKHTRCARAEHLEDLRRQRGRRASSAKANNAGNTDPRYGYRASSLPSWAKVTRSIPLGLRIQPDRHR